MPEATLWWLPAPYDQAQEGPQTICHTCLSMKLASHLGLSLIQWGSLTSHPFPLTFQVRLQLLKLAHAFPLWLLPLAPDFSPELSRIPLSLFSRLILLLPSQPL